MKVSITIDVEFPDHPCRPNNLVELATAVALEGVSPTYFVEGRYAKANPWLAEVLKGQTIGNHSMFHVHHTFLTKHGIEESVKRGETVLKSVFGCEIKPLFRFPFGDFDAYSLGVLHQLGYKHCHWSCDPRDWASPHTETAIESVLSECKRADYTTIVFHSWTDSTEQILIPVIRELKRLNCEFSPIISSRMM